MKWVSNNMWTANLVSHKSIQMLEHLQCQNQILLKDAQQLRFFLLKEARCRTGISGQPAMAYIRVLGFNTRLQLLTLAT